MSDDVKPSGDSRPNPARKFTLSSGEKSQAPGSGSLKIGGGAPQPAPTDPVPKSLQIKSPKSEKTVLQPGASGPDESSPSTGQPSAPAKAAPSKPPPDIQFDETPARGKVSRSPAEKPKIEFTDTTSAAPSKSLLIAEGSAAVVAITFTVLIFRDLLPYL